MARESGFKTPTIKLLKERVAHRCSNPDCRVPTIGPILGELKSGCIGEAAHIFAASPGAARYDPNMTPDERMHFDNGIWLCTNCHTEIDRDPALYPASLLQSWKSNAEAQALQERGEKLPSKTDAIDQLCMAMTRQPQVFIPNAIENVHIASGLALEQLDPRFSVETAYIQRKHIVSLRAKERVSLNLKIKNRDKHEKQWHSFVENGDDFVLSTEEVSINGSDLLKVLVNKMEGRVELKGEKIPANIRLELRNLETGNQFSFFEIQGYITYGTKTFTFNGEACGGLFAVTLRKSHDLSNSKMDVKFTIRTTKWLGLDITRLPHFERLYDFYINLEYGNIKLWLDIEGLNALESDAHSFKMHNDIFDMTLWLTYINKCRELSKHMSRIFYLPESYHYSQSHIDDIGYAIDLYNKNVFHKYEDFKLAPEVSLCLAKKDAISFFEKMNSEVIQFKFTNNQSDTVIVFGEKVILPLIKINIANFMVKVINQEDIDDFNANYGLQIYPKDDFICQLSYEEL